LKLVPVSRGNGFDHNQIALLQDRDLLMTGAGPGTDDGFVGDDLHLGLVRRESNGCCYGTFSGRFFFRFSRVYATSYLDEAEQGHQ
jgi:hypothetical protein